MSHTGTWLRADMQDRDVRLGMCWSENMCVPIASHAAHKDSTTDISVLVITTQEDTRRRPKKNQGFLGRKAGALHYIRFFS